MSYFRIRPTQTDASFDFSTQSSSDKRRHRRITGIFLGLTILMSGLLIAVIMSTLTPYSAEVSNIPHESVAETKVEKVVEKPIIVEETEPKQTKPETQPAPVVHGGNLSKKVYLTFDDGPGAYTTKLLDVLKKYNAKATFFVTCSGDDSLIKREYDEGHAVALHTCSHNYAKIYANDTAFFNDLAEIKARVKRITGYDATMIRFPGGSSNSVSARYNRGIMSRLTKEVGNRGYTYFDWNVSSGDAGSATSSDAVYRNVVGGMGKFSNGAVVLQHDIKSFSVDAVERILQYGQSNGFVFEKLTPTSYTAHHGVSN